MSKCGPPPPSVDFTKPLVHVIPNPGSGKLQQGAGGGAFRVLAGRGVERSSRRLVTGRQVGDPFPLQSAARLGFTPLPSRPGVGAYPHQGSGSRLRKLEAQAKLLEGSWAHCGFTPRGHSYCRNEPLTQLYIRMIAESMEQKRVDAEVRGRAKGKGTLRPSTSTLILPFTLHPLPLKLLTAPTVPNIAPRRRSHGRSSANRTSHWGRAGCRPADRSPSARWGFSDPSEKYPQWG